MAESLFMLFSIEDRIVREGEYICATGATVRQTALVFGVSKSCVHKDVTAKLKYIDNVLYLKTAAVLKKNFAEKHIRGGIATKKKYQKKSADEFLTANNIK